MILVVFDFVGYCDLILLGGAYSVTWVYWMEAFRFSWLGDGIGFEKVLSFGILIICIPFVWELLVAGC